MRYLWVFCVLHSLYIYIYMNKHLGFSDISYNCLIAVLLFCQMWRKKIVTWKCQLVARVIQSAINRPKSRNQGNICILMMICVIGATKGGRNWNQYSIDDMNNRPEFKKVKHFEILIFITATKISYSYHITIRICAVFIALIIRTYVYLSILLLWHSVFASN